MLYSDVRFDLPGDQRQEVSELLARFPGFEDASTLELKADDTFERLVTSATEGDVSYTDDIKPWFGGQVAVAMTGLPNLGSLIEGGGSGLDLPVVGLISVKDAAAAETSLDRFAAEAQSAGMNVSTAEVDGHPTWTITDAAAQRSRTAVGNGHPHLRHAGRGHGCGSRCGERQAGHAGRREPGRVVGLR